MAESGFVRSVEVSAFETTIEADGFLDGNAGASLRQAAAAYGVSSERIVITLLNVHGHDAAGIQALERILDDALEGGWGLELRSADAELRHAAADRRLPFT
jgi:hypothetical protein